MRLTSLSCALALAAGVPAVLVAQEGVAPTVVAAKTGKKPVKKKVVKPSGPPAKELFGAAKTPGAHGGARHRLLRQGMPRRRRGAAHRRSGLAGHAPLAQPQLGPPRARRAGREAGGRGASAHDGWPGLLVGDISQPRGGPMLTGHASHQVGLDADIWLTPMPDRRLTEQEREDLSATSMLAPDGVSVDPKLWTDAHVRLLKRAASYASVERIFVHPAIKKALCEATAKDADRTWLHKMQAYWGHYYHFHVRIACPEGSTNCEHQQPLPNNDGCGKELDQLAGAGQAEAETGNASGRGCQAGAAQARHHARSAAGGLPLGAGRRRGHPGDGLEARHPARYGDCEETHHHDEVAERVCRPSRRTTTARRVPYRRVPSG